jgi:hypothetical protein
MLLYTALSCSWLTLRHVQPIEPAVIQSLPFSIFVFHCHTLLLCHVVLLLTGVCPNLQVPVQLEVQPTPKAMEYPNVYGLWTNKGGVGKTTLSYHLATTYAKLFPNKVVVAIDMCPQANLSSTLLTNASGEMQGCS